ncbi:hypothetical protein LPJ53_000025 [Coemansia erecta]|uniref:Uncharacterized protein n=1 Tax=Coemansia erecta TaxID=147472 RepID=A0A9W7Y8B5_9FUNG|nr:hypothetical protein LPJ53_000025 [Coemansia erecta]
MHQQQIALEEKAQEHEIQSQQGDAQMIDGNPNEQVVQVDDGAQTSMDAVDAAVAAVEDIAATIGSSAPANPDLDTESATNVIQSISAEAPDNGIDTIVSDNASPEPPASLQTTVEQNDVVVADVSTSSAVEAQQSETIVESTSEAEPGAAFTSTPN